jgi:hypothetical protein
MNSFLYRVADAFYSTYNKDINKFTFVFPNRRAGLFFQKYISQLIDKPLFSPEILTINECFSSATQLQAADRLSNLFLIYKIYKQISKTEESFDSFIFWGEMLLNDFDEVDKYLVDAYQLFQNVTELNEIERMFNVLSERQISAIKQFWKNFIPVSEEKTKEQFIATWKVLYDVYNEFVTQLKNNSLGTEGMICREVAEKLKNKESVPELDSKSFVFIGFNALNPCEQVLMSELLKRGQADFYWDYESDELRDADNPASQFFADNTHVFPSKLLISTDNLSLNDKEISLVGVPSAVGMTKQVYSTLEKLCIDKQPSDSWIDTAVILPDENLLVPMLYAFPEQIAKINITMGYPLSSTPVAGLISQIFELQRRIRVTGSKVLFYHKNISDILNHQYVSQLLAVDCSNVLTDMARFNKIYVNAADLHKNTLFRLLFSPVNSTVDLIHYLLEIIKQLSFEWQNNASENADFQIERDFLHQFYLTINRIETIVSQNSVDAGMSMDTLGKIIQQLVAGISIPFIGEPLDGLQVMGVLESRGLDFENVIITSFNEGVFPKKSSQNSFIPYNLRKGFGLPTFEYHDAITSYNFYRLIHRAKRLYFIYDARTEGLQNAEVSRYINQLNYHYGLNIQKKSVNYDISFGETKQIVVHKTPEILQKLQLFFSENEDKRYLSASSIKSYIDCPLQFYLTRVERVDQAEEVKETVEDTMFGTLFHTVMEYIYKPLTGRLIQKEEIEILIKSLSVIDKHIRRAFNEEFFQKKNADEIELEGNNLLIASVLRKYVIKVLQYDKSYAPFVLIESEKKLAMTIKTQRGNVNIVGVIDRIDEKDGKLRVLDYKTGGGTLDFTNWEEVFEHNNDKRPKYILQTFLYGMLYKEHAGTKKIEPGIIYLRELFKDKFRTEILHKPTNSYVDDYRDFELEFGEHLTNCLDEIFNDEIPFVQTESNKPCEYCVYKTICNR